MQSMGEPALDRPKRWFLKAPPRSTMGELAALAAEAHRRKISYGQLVSSTADFERFEIVEAYRRGECERGT